MTKRQELYCRLMGALSGLLLVIPNLYPGWTLLQAVALVPIFYLAADTKINFRHMLVAGMYMGLFYTLPQLAMFRLPIWMACVLLVYLMVLLMLLACGAKWLFGKSSLAGCFAVGCFLVVFDWVNITAVPIWGTAQSFVRCWSQYPGLIIFTSFTGMAGIIFLLGVLQALFVNFLINPKLRRRITVTAAIVVSLVLTANKFAASQQPVNKIKVAAMGWTSQDYEDINSQKGFDTLFAKAVAQAAEQEAKLIVFPEMAFYIADKNEKIMEQIAETARRNNMFLVTGYFNGAKQENRLLFMSSEGAVLSEYTKTNLTVFEDFNKGDGQLKTIDLNGVRIGGMICQDDNFTSLSRGYGRMATGIVAVPTLDWLTVKNAHFQSSIHRAIESRYGIVRAACNGISAIISPTGQILARRNHFVEGPGVIVAEMPVYNCRTFFSIAGNWLVAASFVYFIFYVVLIRLIERKKFINVDLKNCQENKT